MVRYELKKDVVINGMDFKCGTIVDIPQKKVDEFEGKAFEVPKKKNAKKNGDGDTKKERFRRRPKKEEEVVEVVNDEN